MTTFNAYGTSAKEIGKTNKPVWLGVVTPHAVGGVLAENFRIAGAHYPAGTPVNLTAGILTPVLTLSVKAVATGKITVDPSEFNIAPAVGDKVQAIGESTTAAAITAVAPNSANADLLDVTVSLTGVSVGDAVAIMPSSETAYAAPNGYLYNDIYLGDLSEANATGACVDFHGEGLLIDFTPAAAIKAVMKANVPNVVQVEFPEGAFVTE